MTFAAVVDRVRTEFVEMPGMQLTLAQAIRLWNLGADDCRSVDRRAGRHRLPALDAAAHRGPHRPRRGVGPAHGQHPTFCVRRQTRFRQFRRPASRPADVRLAVIFRRCCSRASPDPSGRPVRPDRRSVHATTPSAARYDEMFDAAGRRAAALPGAARRAADRLAGGAAPPPGRGRPRLPDPGHHLHRLRRRAGHRADLPVRPAAADHHRARMGHARARPDAAADRDQPVPQGRLPRGPDPLRGHRAARPGLQLPPLPARDARRPRPPRHLRLDRRHRPGPPRRRRVRRARGQPARAERRVVHARQPRGHQARLPRPVQPLQRAADRPLRPGAAGDAARAGAAEPARPDLRRADARRRQLRLLRARLPGARDGRPAGRGARPAGPRQHRLHADDVRAAAGRRDLPPRRRRLPRPAGVPRAIRTSASPGCSTPIAPATSRSPTPSAPASPTTRRSTPTSRRSSASTCRRSRSCRTSRPTCSATRRIAQLRARATSTSWWSRRSASRAATAC